METWGTGKSTQATFLEVTQQPQDDMCAGCSGGVQGSRQVSPRQEQSLGGEPRGQGRAQPSIPAGGLHRPGQRMLAKLSCSFPNLMEILRPQIQEVQ